MDANTLISNDLHLSGVVKVTSPLNNTASSFSPGSGSK